MTSRSIHFAPMEEPPGAPRPSKKRRDRKPPVRADFPTAPPRGPIVILGDLTRDIRLLDGDVKRLPKSAAEYDTRLELMLQAAHRIVEDLSKLLIDYRERES
jgi:hypothetical protein